MDILVEINGEQFVWDDAKAQKNWQKHGIRFDEAAHVFFDPLFKLTDASRNHEQREAAIGLDASGRLLFVVHIDIEDTAIRIISARRAESHEEMIYAV